MIASISSHNLFHTISFQVTQRFHVYMLAHSQACSSAHVQVETLIPKLIFQSDSCYVPRQFKCLVHLQLAATPSHSNDDLVPPPSSVLLPAFAFSPWWPKPARSYPMLSNSSMPISFFSPAYYPPCSSPSKSPLTLWCYTVVHQGLLEHSSSCLECLYHCSSCWMFEQRDIDSGRVAARCGPNTFYTKAGFTPWSQQLYIQLAPGIASEGSCRSLFNTAQDVSFFQLEMRVSSGFLASQLFCPSVNTTM